ncbi:MAG: enoyl-ACP reductase FabV, partial [Gammaproteobacteria bacterium]
RIRGFVCTTAHPKGCQAHVLEQIAYVKSLPQDAFSHSGTRPKNVLIIGASTGYGLASRITAAFGYGANTVGIFFEKEPTAETTGSAGWYNTVAFEAAANAQNLQAFNINGDAFSDELKEKTIALLKEKGLMIDLVIYSLASPRRTHPKTGHVAKSVLKPIGQPFTGKTLDTDKLEVRTVNIDPATETEIADTVQVMGGEDWEFWMTDLAAAGVLKPDSQTVSYTYIGAKQTWPIYGKAAIGRAKEDLDRAGKVINQSLESKGGAAYVAVMKAIVTQASSAIPIMPLYISLLYKVMKDQKLHEGAIEQVARLFSTQLYTQTPKRLDEQGRIRMDELELKPSVQEAVEALWDKADTGNIQAISDIKGYQAEFLKLFGFGFESIDYDQEVSPIL